MSGLEIALLVVGILFFAGSFFFTEKLSSSDIETIEKMSEKEVNVLVDKQLKGAAERIDRSIDARLTDSLNRFDTEINKKTTEEIYSISEHGETVRTDLDRAVDAEKKSREEVMFLYERLTDKQESVTEITREAQQLESALRTIKQSVEEAIDRLEKGQTLQNVLGDVPKPEAKSSDDDDVAALLDSMAQVMLTDPREETKATPVAAQAAPETVSETEQAASAPNAAETIAPAGAEEATSAAPASTDTAAFDRVSFEEEIARQLDDEVQAAEEAQSEGNINERILTLHREGFSDVEIAKQLGKGLGEIRLVLGLYDEDDA